jgi:hypothetical protein
MIPYSLVQINKVQWEYLAYLVRTEREKILNEVPDTQVRRNRTNELTSILNEIERAIKNLEHK